MELKLKLNHDILREIAEAKANRVAYDWFESTGKIPDATKLYTEAFLDGMLYMVERLKNGDIS